MTEGTIAPSEREGAADEDANEEGRAKLHCSPALSW